MQNTNTNTQPTKPSVAECGLDTLSQTQHQFINYESTESQQLRRPPGLTAKGQQRIYVDHHYVDRSQQTIHEPRTIKEREALDYYHQGQIAGQFPLKLQTLLHKVEKLGMNHIFGWQPHGRSFTIRDPAEFESILMTRFFNQRQISSFRRQLNLYNFKRITRGPDAGSYYHEMFLRSKPLLACKMTRRKVKGTKFRATSSPENEPDFYTMPYLETDCDATRSSIAPLMSVAGTGFGNINEPFYSQGYDNYHNDFAAAAAAAAATAAAAAAAAAATATATASNSVTPSSSATSFLYSRGNTRDLFAYQEEINNRRMEALLQQASLPTSSSYGLSSLSSFLSGLPAPQQNNARQAGSSTFDYHDGVGEFYESSDAMSGLLGRQANNSTVSGSFLRDVEANDLRSSIINNAYNSRNQVQNLYSGSDRGNNTTIGAIQNTNRYDHDYNFVPNVFVQEQSNNSRSPSVGLEALLRNCSGYQNIQTDTYSTSDQDLRANETRRNADQRTDRPFNFARAA